MSLTTLLTTTELISISKEFQVRVMNSTLQTHSNTVIVHDAIPLPQQPSIPAEEIRFELQLEDVLLDDIHELLCRARNIQSKANIQETFENWNLFATTPSWSTIIQYIIGVGV